MLRETIRTDCQRNRGKLIQLFLALYRIGHHLYGAKSQATGLKKRWIGFQLKLVTIPYKFLCHGYGCFLPFQTTIGPGLRLRHAAYGIFIAPDVVAGENLELLHHVTIGMHYERGTGRVLCPTLGDDVFIGANASVIGEVHVGDGAQIGAGATVVTDVPPGATAVGAKARMLPPRDDENTIPDPEPATSSAGS